MAQEPYRALLRRLAATAVGATLGVTCAGDEREPEDDATGEPSGAPGAPGEAAPREITLDPPLDFALSPYTGWTRAHHEALFARMCLGLAEHVSDDGAWVEASWSGFDGSRSYMAITRMLLGVGAWLAEPSNPAVFRVRGIELDLIELARAALLSGTDPASAGYWGDIVRGEQLEVEAAFVAQFLVDSRERVWATLDEPARAQVMAWLSANDTTYQSNWVLFPATRNIARAVLGYPVDPAALAAQLDVMESMYVGDGWYADGKPGSYDYYNSFVIHPGLLWWAVQLGDTDPARRDRVIRRARAFVDHLVHFFDERGAAVAFGRSLSYRAAVLAGIQALEHSGASPLAPGLARRLSSGNLKFHVGARVDAEDRALDGHDLLRAGLIAEEHAILEGYHEHGAQYFMSRALDALRLPPEHPYWSAIEAPAPADTGSFEHVIPAVGLSLDHAPEVGAVTLMPTALESSASLRDKYGRLAYSSQYYFHAANVTPPFPSDSLVVSAALDEFSSLRGEPLAGLVAPGFAFTRYTIAPEGPMDWINRHELASAGVAHDGATLRVSCARSSLSEHALLREGGASLALDERARWQVLPWSRPALHVESEAGAVLLVGVHGYDRVELAEPLANRPNVIDPSARYPLLSDDDPALSAACVVSYQRLGARADELAPYEHLVAEVSVDGELVELALSDGQEVWINMSPETDLRTVTLGGASVTGRLRFARVDPARGRVTAVGAELVVVAPLVADAAEPWSFALDADAGDEPPDSTRPSVLDCRLQDAATLRCELSGPATIDAPWTAPSRAWGRVIGTGWRVIDSVAAGQPYALSPARFDELAGAQALSHATVELRRG